MGRAEFVDISLKIVSVGCYIENAVWCQSFSQLFPDESMTRPDGIRATDGKSKDGWIERWLEGRAGPAAPNGGGGLARSGDLIRGGLRKQH